MARRSLSCANKVVLTLSGVWTSSACFVYRRSSWWSFRPYPPKVVAPCTPCSCDMQDRPPSPSANPFRFPCTRRTSYEPNDYFLTETYLEFNQESVTEQRFPEDLDYDDTVIGQTLFNAYRRQVDHSEGEGLSSGLSSSSMSHDRTGKPVVDRDKSYESG